MSFRETTSDASQTRSVGERLASRLRSGDVLALTGPLGSGKTTFVQGVASGLSCDRPATSSSFVLMQHYDGPTPLVHIDLYRVRDRRELSAAGVDDAVGDPRAVTAVEWADRFPALLPDVFWRVHIEPADSTREITIDEP
jgi:tRNA threonylcarbamoyladenosine biosynthesis protein TsaE